MRLRGSVPIIIEARANVALAMMAEPRVSLPTEGTVVTTVVDWHPNGDGSKNLRLVVQNPTKRSETRAPKPAEVPNIVRLLGLAREWQSRLDAGEFRSRSQLAEHMGVGPVRVSTILGLLRLHPAILAHIESLPPGTPQLHLTERWLRPIARLPHAEQLTAVAARLGSVPLAELARATLTRAR